MSEFYGYFKANMDALGLGAPQSLYGTYQAAVSVAAELGAAIRKFGTSVTVLELIVAGTRLEKLAVVGTLGACYYLGAVIGSIAVATGRTLSGGTSISDVFATASRVGANTAQVRLHLLRNPGIYNGMGDRAYKNRAIVAGRIITANKAIV